jgi:hypothetical protein
MGQLSENRTKNAQRMTSIRHFPATHPLPDWRNFGVMLRVLLGINALALLAALVQAPGWPAGWGVMSNWRRWSSPVAAQPGLAGGLRDGCLVALCRCASGKAGFAAGRLGWRRMPTGSRWP